MVKANIMYREAVVSDIPGIARLRTEEWGKIAYWEARISAYLNSNVTARQALPTCIIYVAISDEKIVGFIAGHLTERFGCDGELQWINVTTEYRGTGISSELFTLLARWFTTHKASYVCVDCTPDNIAARRLYKKHGAKSLNKHWMIWTDISALSRRE